MVVLRVAHDVGALQMVTVTTWAPAVANVVEKESELSGIVPDAGVPPWAVQVADVITVAGTVSPMMT